MNQNSRCALVGFGLLVGMMAPGVPVVGLAIEAVDCIGLS